MLSVTMLVRMLRHSTSIKEIFFRYRMVYKKMGDGVNRIFIPTGNFLV